MASSAATLSVFILSGFISLSAASKDTCDLYAAIGESLAVPFVYDGLTNFHVLRWTHNSTIIFYREKGTVSFGKTNDISATGSLLLKDLKFSSAGNYQANVLHPNDTLARHWSGRLCIMDKVSKPQLTYVCDSKTGAVKLNCNVAKAQGLVFSWTLDEKALTSETGQTLSVSVAQLKGERFTCSVANKVSKEKSDIVRPTCSSPPPPAALCFTFKTVAAALAGGAGLILLLLLIIIVLCCRNKSEMRHGDKGELRMVSLHKREPDSVCPEYETMHPAEESPAPSPEPSPKACYESVSQPEGQTQNRPSQLSAAAEGQGPSPVPKPRMKTLQTPNV